MRGEKRFRVGLVAISIIGGICVLAEGQAYRYTTDQFATYTQRAEGSTERLRILRRVYIDLVDAESSVRGYVITGERGYLVPYERAKVYLGEDLPALRQAMGLGAGGRSSLLDDITSGAETEIADLAEVVRLREQKGWGAAYAQVVRGEDEVRMEQLRERLESVMDKENSTRTEVLREVAKSSSSAAASWNTAMVLILATLSLGVFALWQVSVRNDDLARRLRHESRHDDLTGLAKRRYFRDTLDYLLAVAAREQRMTAVLYLDLDGFKPINDELGHDKGDLTLVEVAKTLRSVLRESDFLARLGGDEFAVLVAATEGDERALCQRICQAISALDPPFLNGRRLSVSIGMAVAPRDGRTTEELLSVADTRMLEEKRRGKSLCLGRELASET